MPLATMVVAAIIAIDWRSHESKSRGLMTNAINRSMTPRGWAVEVS
jgi:hypothetical protein